MSPEQLATLAELVRCNGYGSVLAELQSAAREAADHANEIGDAYHEAELRRCVRQIGGNSKTIAVASDMIASALDIAAEAAT